MNRKERYSKYSKICTRAEKGGKYHGGRISLLMDIESADTVFSLRLEEWLNADDNNFFLDLFGIINCIKRDHFPATDFGVFVPRFASHMHMSECNKGKEID